MSVFVNIPEVVDEHGVSDNHQTEGRLDEEGEVFE